LARSAYTGGKAWRKNGATAERVRTNPHRDALFDLEQRRQEGIGLSCAAV